MENKEAIAILTKNRDANKDRPKFTEACNMAIAALHENEPLKRRCFTLSDGTLCSFCRMKCEMRRKI